MLKGAWDYWANFANLPGTEGRWFPLGFGEKYRNKGWYEVNDIPHPAILGWMENVFNEGEEYEKNTSFASIFCSAIIYGIDAFRFFQAALSLWNGKTDRLIESHEVEKEFQKDSHQLLDKD